MPPLRSTPVAGWRRGAAPDATVANIRHSPIAAAARQCYPAIWTYTALHAVLVRLLAFVKSMLRRLGLLPAAKRLLAPLIQSTTQRAPPGSVRYRLRAAIEQANYADVQEVHDLPAIFHYWSNTYLQPKCLALGFSHPDDLYLQQMLAALATNPHARFLSIGAGNCDLEVRLARQLRDRGHADFVLTCLDLNDAMLRRGQDAAARADVSANLAFIQADFNTWRPATAFDVVIANQSLHHVTELEHLFAAVQDAIGDTGCFVTSDMIGRNGHQRWPEARTIIDTLWVELPAAKRHNHLQRQYEPTFQDWDASVSGFEGIRAQDILPLLVERFHFALFLPFGNLIDPFTDRAFGPNFDPDDAADRAFIDRVHALDEAELLAGRITPTHMLAVMRNAPVDKPRYWQGIEPRFCLRKAPSGEGR